MTGAPPLRAIQQLQLGTVCGTAAAARRTLALVVEAGFQGIELNGFMIRPTPPLVRALTRAAGMPVGRGGRLDWATLVGESGLTVVGLHEDLGAIERDAGAVVREAARYGTGRVVVPGMYRFAWTDPDAVAALARRLDAAGERLADAGLRLLFHNHNAELRRLPSGRTAYAELVARTDPDRVGFEFDAYWPAAAGAGPRALLRGLGERVELLHVTDRGTRARGVSLTPIDRADAVELGDGTMDLVGLLADARHAGVAAVICETHRNWVDRSPIASLQRSARFLRAHLPDRQDAA